MCSKIQPHSRAEYQFLQADGKIFDVKHPQQFLMISAVSVPLNRNCYSYTSHQLTNTSLELSLTFYTPYSESITLTDWQPGHSVSCPTHVGNRNYVVCVQYTLFTSQSSVGKCCFKDLYQTPNILLQYVIHSNTLSHTQTNYFSCKHTNTHYLIYLACK